MAWPSRPSETRRARTKTAPTRPEAIGTVISSKQMSKFSALLWGIGCVSGELLILLPHGAGENVAGLSVVAAFAGIVAVGTFWQGDRLSLAGNYVLSFLALVAVTGAVLCAHHSPVGDGIAGLYVLPTIFTASFYSTRAFTIYLFAQAATSGAVLLTSGVTGASAGWAVLLGTTVTVGVAVHVLQQALQLAATTDPLTGLVNRRAFVPVLARELHRCARLAHPLSLIVIDLDHFKEVNDTHGHLVGSRLLAEVGSLMKRVLGPENSCFRYGGDEFVALLPGMGKQAGIVATMQLWEALRDEAFLSGQALNLKLSGSFGLATFPEDGNSVQAIIRAADTMMYAAKTTRDNVSVAGLGLVAGSEAGVAVPAGKTATMAAADLITMRRASAH
jgi:diguanylate cyclase (GGDEF)-like protein